MLLASSLRHLLPKGLLATGSPVTVLKGGLEESLPGARPAQAGMALWGSVHLPAVLVLCSGGRQAVACILRPSNQRDALGGGGLTHPRSVLLPAL